MSTIIPKSSTRVRKSMWPYASSSEMTPVAIIRRGADDGGARTVDSQVGRAADGEDEVGEEEDGARDDREEHARGSYIGPGAEVVAGRGRPFPTAFRSQRLRGVWPIRYTWGSPDGGHAVL